MASSSKPETGTWVLTQNALGLDRVVVYYGVYATGFRLISGLQMKNGVPPLISIPKMDATSMDKTQIATFCNEPRRQYAKVFDKEAISTGMITIYQEATLIQMADDNHLLAAAPSRKRARIQTEVDEPCIQRLFAIGDDGDTVEDGEVPDAQDAHVRAEERDSHAN